MSYSGYGDLIAKCPYYTRESKYSLVCMGILPGSELASKFDNEKTKKEHMKRNCAKYPNVCPIFLQHERMCDEECRKI